MASASDVLTSSDTGLANLHLMLDNESDANASVITVSGRDQKDLLVQITAGFKALDLQVVSASILTDDDDNVLDVFRVLDNNDEKVFLHGILAPCQIVFRVFYALLAARFGGNPRAL